jgi:hypothetical protein
MGSTDRLLVEFCERKAQQINNLVRQRAQLIVRHGLDTFGHVCRQANINRFWLWLVGHVILSLIAMFIIEVYAIVSNIVAIAKEYKYN